MEASIHESVRVCAVGREGGCRLQWMKEIVGVIERREDHDHPCQHSQPRCPRGSQVESGQLERAGIKALVGLQSTQIRLQRENLRWC